MYLHSRLYSWNSLLLARWCWSFVVVYKCCSGVSDLCHEIAVVWLVRTFVFDDLVICCHYRMTCILFVTFFSVQKLVIGMTVRENDHIYEILG